MKMYAPQTTDYDYVPIADRTDRATIKSWHADYHGSPELAASDLHFRFNLDVNPSDLRREWKSEALGTRSVTKAINDFFKGPVLTLRRRHGNDATKIVESLSNLHFYYLQPKDVEYILRKAGPLKVEQKPVAENPELISLRKEKETLAATNLDLTTRIETYDGKIAAYQARIAAYETMLGEVAKVTSKVVPIVEGLKAQDDKKKGYNKSEPLTAQVALKAEKEAHSRVSRKGLEDKTVTLSKSDVRKAHEDYNGVAGVAERHDKRGATRENYILGWKGLALPVLEKGYSYVYEPEILKKIEYAVEKFGKQNLAAEYLRKKKSLKLGPAEMSKALKIINAMRELHGQRPIGKPGQESIDDPKKNKK